MTESLESLNRIADELLSLDAEGRAIYYEYDDEDLMNATIVFQHIMGNRMSHNMLKTDLSVEQNVKLAEMYATAVKHAIINMTGWDPSKHYRTPTKSRK